MTPGLNPDQAISVSLEPLVGAVPDGGEIAMWRLAPGEATKAPNGTKNFTYPS